MKTYITFGYNHIHEINGVVFDKDCVAVIQTPGDDNSAGRIKAFEMFGPKFCFEYPEQYWNEDKLKYFPRGYIYIKE